MISLPVEVAFKLLAAGKVRINGVLCRFKKQTALKQCSGSLGFNGIVKACTSSNSRLKRSRRYGPSSKPSGADSNCSFAKKRRIFTICHIGESSMQILDEVDMRRTLAKHLREKHDMGIIS